jgi:hypothetical protein
MAIFQLSFAFGPALLRPGRIIPCFWKRPACGGRPMLETVFSSSSSKLARP